MNLILSDRLPVCEKGSRPLAVLVFLLLLLELPLSTGAVPRPLIRLLLVFAASVLYLLCRRLRDGPEILLLFLYGLWLALTRILNGDYFFRTDTAETLCLCASFVLPSAGLLLPREKRSRFLLWFSGLLCAVYTLLALPGIYTAVSGGELVKPQDGSIISCFASCENRLTLFGRNPNYSSICFFISCFLLLYRFYRSKSRRQRLLLALAFVPNYLALALTYSRNVMLGFSLCVSALLFLGIRPLLRLRRGAWQALVLLAVMLWGTLLVYKSFDLSTQLVNLVSQSVSPAEQTAPVEIPTAAGDDGEAPKISDDFEDTRGFQDSGRIPIWKSALPVLRGDPLRLLRGSVDVMADANDWFYEQYSVHGREEYKEFALNGAMYYHNMPLQVLMTTGLPGLGLVLAYLALLARHMLRLFFAGDNRVGADVKVLVLLLAGIFGYNMLECSLFYNNCLSSVCFFVLSGFVIAESRELIQN